jgi:hypothetical protein
VARSSWDRLSLPRYLGKFILEGILKASFINIMADNEQVDSFAKIAVEFLIENMSRVAK